MNQQVPYTREFDKAIKKLIRAGRRLQAQKTHDALGRALQGFKIDLKRTNHGETRAKVNKYDLGDGYRLITQDTDDGPVFLFVGTHDEVDIWLNRHRNYRWVRDGKTGYVNFMLVTESLEHPQVGFSMDPESRELLEELTDEDWDALGIPNGETRTKISKFTNHELDAEGLRLLQTLHLTEDQKNCILDLWVNSFDGNSHLNKARIAAYAGNAHIVADEDVSSELIKAGSNTDVLIIKDEEWLKLLKSDHWDDWMLFLHPDQRHLVEATYNGPARLRGVSGSGKTSIVIHRAVAMARRYERPVLIVTLTSALVRHLEGLARILCGDDTVVFNRLRFCTVAKMATKLVREWDYGSSKILDSQYGEILSDSDTRRTRLAAIRKSGAIGKLRNEPTLAAAFDDNRLLSEYILDEIDYVRTSFPADERDRYLRETRFGRHHAVGAEGRKAIIKTVTVFEEYLGAEQKFDNAGLTLSALSAVRKKIDWDALCRDGDYPYPLSRCVLVDESQDLSENDLRLVGMVAPPLEDGLFIAGDLAQKIYKRGFAFSRAGLEIRGRSTVLTGNYRNTYQILDAAHQLIDAYTPQIQDDGGRFSPSAPDLSSRQGRKPLLRGFFSIDDELEWVALQIEDLVGTQGYELRQIAVISGAKAYRTKIMEILRSRNIEFKEYTDRESSDGVTVSTIESAKGLEYAAVFVVGVLENYIPQARAINQDEIWREASRLYVAMTRARDEVALTWSLEIDNKGVRSPSRFIGTLKPKCRVESPHGLLND